MSLIWGSGRNKNNGKQIQNKSSGSSTLRDEQNLLDLGQQISGAEKTEPDSTSPAAPGIDSSDPVDSTDISASINNGESNINATPDIELTCDQAPNPSDPNPNRNPERGSNVVDLNSYSSANRSSKANIKCSETSASGSEQGSTNATLLQFRARAEYIAAIEIDDFLSLKMLYSDIDLQLLLDRMGYLLKREFGEEAVSREQREFLIQFDDFELLVGGLLRAQFYAYKVDLPSYNIFGELSEQTGLLLTWGIGHSDQEAHAELVKKKRYKQQRRKSKRNQKPVEPG